MPPAACGSGQRALPRHARASRKAGRRRGRLPDHDQALGTRLDLAADLRAAPASRAGSADGPVQSTTIPPVRTRGRHHSIATGGSASALATATPNVSSGCSSARPQTTRRFGSSDVQRSRKSHLRRSASSSVTARSGRAAASGIPGVPPPEPTSTTGPGRSGDQSGSARERRRAGPGALRRRRGAPSGLALRRARASHRSRMPATVGSSCTATRMGSLVRRRCGGGARRRTGWAPCPRSPSRPRDRPSAPRGRPSAPRPSSARARRCCPVAVAFSAQRRAIASTVSRPPGPVPGRVDRDRPPRVPLDAMRDRVGEVLQGVERLPVTPDQHTGVRARTAWRRSRRRSPRGGYGRARRSPSWRARGTRARPLPDRWSPPARPPPRHHVVPTRSREPACSRRRAGPARPRRRPAA